MIIELMLEFLKGPFWSCTSPTVNKDLPDDVLCDTAIYAAPAFKILGLIFSSKLDWGSYTIAIAKTTSKKIGVLIRSMKFLSPEVALYLYKSTIRPCMEYCCHVRLRALNSYLELF